MAAVVVSKPEFEDDIEYNTIGRIHSDSPLPIVPIIVSKPEHNLTGKRFGNFVVQGAFPLVNPKVNRRWVVKCDCGRYEARERRLLMRRRKYPMSCIKCTTLRDKLRKLEEEVKKDGKRDDERIAYNLGEYKGKGRFKKPGQRYTIRLKAGDIIYNVKGEKTSIISLSSESITFEDRCFKSYERIYLEVSEREAEQRKRGDFRKLLTQ